MDNIFKYKIWILIVGLLLLTGLTILNTYALFETNATSTDSLEIGKWKIYINGNDLDLSQTITLNDFEYVNGTHTEDGYFAPGSSATFDVVIDTSESDVSVEYQLDIDDSQIEEYPNINFEIKNMNTNEVITSNTINGVIGLNDTNREITLRISIDWENDSQYDESDSTLIGEELQFLIAAHFTQYTGE